VWFLTIESEKTHGMVQKSKMWSDKLFIHKTGAHMLIGLSPKASQYSLYNVVPVTSTTAVTIPCSVQSLVSPLRVVGPNTDSMACALLWPLEVDCSHC
jgi:hypothetical protein